MGPAWVSETDMGYVLQPHVQPYPSHPAQAEEKVFGTNLAAALQGRSLGVGLGWLTAEQRAAARGLAAEVWGRGAESLTRTRTRTRTRARALTRCGGVGPRA